MSEIYPSTSQTEKPVSGCEAPVAAWGDVLNAFLPLARQVVGVLLFYLLAVTPARAEDDPSAESRIRTVLSAQTAAWNAGDVETFMDGYTRGPELRFASGGEVTRGWQETLDRYRRRYPDRAAMGVLTFSDLEINVLSTDAAVVFGRWRLRLATDAEPAGLFTLLWRREGDGQWRIVSDHTSAGVP